MTQRAVEKKKRSNQIIRPCILGCSHVKTSLELPKITVKSKLFRKYFFREITTLFLGVYCGMTGGVYL